MPKRLTTLLVASVLGTLVAGAEAAPATTTATKPTAEHTGMMGGYGGRGGMMGGGMMNGGGMRGGQPGPQAGQPNGNDNLSDAQRQQIQTIQKRTQQKNRALNRQIRAEQAKLHQLMQSPKPDPAQVSKAYDTIDSLQHRIYENSAAARQRINAVMAQGVPSSGQSSAPGHHQQAQNSSVAMGMSVDRSFCARCHAAPNPMQHTAAQWPLVVDRMRRYMYQQGMPMPDAVQTKALLNYLQTNAYPGNHAHAHQ